MCDLDYLRFAHPHQPIVKQRVDAYGESLWRYADDFCLSFWIVWNKQIVHADVAPATM